MSQSAKELEKSLFYRRTLTADREGVMETAKAFCEDYKLFLDSAKTEREAAATCERRLLDAGYKPYQPGKSYEAGEKIYLLHREKAIIAATIGSCGLEEGFRIVAAHLDSPRLDLCPVPLYEKDEMSFFRTHYYGGVRKYQWATIPLAIHGVVTLRSGEKKTISVGEQEGDPVFCITDLLPHLSRKQNERSLSEGIKGEELNVLVGSEPFGDEETSRRVKLNTLHLLNEKYGLVERDLLSAEIEVVPATRAKDVGFDRAMVGAYGQDDRVDAYGALLAELAVKDPCHTTVLVLTDKEEIGSEGVTGLNSMYLAQFLKQLCSTHKADDIRAFQNSVCLSADVTAAYDPNWSSAFEKDNATYAGKGVAIYKYTGARGKSGASDASAELTAWVTDLLDKHEIVWQIGEMGVVDLGGGGTVAKYIAYHNIPTIDLGVPVLSMHSPFEVVAKTDVYMAHKAFEAFLNT